MNINIHQPSIHFHGAPAMASALLAAMLRGEEPDDTGPVETTVSRHKIGQYLEGQGGIFVGDFLAGDGSTFGLISSAEEDIGSATWGPEDELPDLTDWDGLTNTAALLDTCPAAKLAAGYTRDGHNDFYLPAQRELQLASANIRHLFGKAGWYATSTPYIRAYAWAVDFEYGTTFNYYRGLDFRVRPFRRFIY